MHLKMKELIKKRKACCVMGLVVGQDDFIDLRPS